MNDYELHKFCERNPNCGCNCFKCPAFNAYMRHELGLDEEEEEY